MKAFIILLAIATTGFSQSVTPERAEYLRLNKLAWEQIAREFPEFVSTAKAKAETLKWMRLWQIEAEKERPDLAKDPLRPLQFARWEAEHRRIYHEQRAAARTPTRPRPIADNTSRENELSDALAEQAFQMQQMRLQLQEMENKRLIDESNRFADESRNR